MWFLLHVTLLLPVIITAIPSHVAKSASVSASFEDSGSKPLVSFDHGNVGVDFLGYRASAGLGGLLTGNLADGGLHAEAGTPHGQSAGAGLGGTVDAGGRAAGGLYAGATAGAGVSAGAGLAGVSGGGVETHVTKISHKPVASGKITTSVVSAPVVHKEVEIIEEQPQPKTTYIQRTVIPNYVEKTVQVPSYVEKTVRVPTTIEKRIRVPAEPTIIEKTVEAPEAPQTVTYVQKTKVHGHRRPHIHNRVYYKNIGYGGGAGGFGAGYGGFGYGGGYGGGGYGGGGASGTYTVSTSPQLYNDIFNIPISTLNAVSKLVGGIAGGATVSKSFSVGGGAAAGAGVY